jgi:Uma2 family endonuclease
MTARATRHPVFYSFRDYILLERDSPIKHEYIGGQILAMSGGTAQHSLLTAAISHELMGALRDGHCRVYNSDMRVRIRKADVSTYPDVSVVCGPREPDPEDKDSITNPVLIVEVASKSTEKYDRGVKFEYYRQIRSLREYVLVSQSERAIEVWRRTGNRWSNQVARAGEQVELRSVGVVLDVDAIYQAATEEQTRKPRSGDRRRRRTSRKGTARRRSR